MPLPRPNQITARTDTIIDGLDNTDKTMEKGCDEINVILDAKCTTPTIKIQDKDIKQKYKEYLRQQKLFIKQKLDKELGHLEMLFRSTRSKAIENIPAESKHQQALGTLSQSIIQTCTKEY